MNNKIKWTTLVLAILSFTGLLFPNFTRAQCPNQAINLFTQSEVDAFAQNYPNCTELLQSLSITMGIPDPDSIQNLDGLQQIVKIGQDLSISNNSLVYWSTIDLMGLQNLTEIGRDLFVRSFEQLNFAGLGQLQTIGRNLNIDQCTATDFSGLGNLERIGGGFRVERSAFESFAGLDNLRNIELSFSLSESLVLGSLGMPSLQRIGGDLFISSSCFKDFVGMENLSDFSGRFQIFDTYRQSFPNLPPPSECNAASSLLGLSAIDSLTTLTINESNIVDLGDFTSLVYIEEKLGLDFNNNLGDISGLLQLQHIGGTLSVSSADKLLSLHGLENLRTMNFGEIVIALNDLLIDITALRNLDMSTVSNFVLTDHLELTICDNFNLCNYFSNGGNGSVSLNGSAGEGCFNKTELLLTCEDNFSKVSYTTFYDLNQNKVQDANEPFFPDASVIVDPGNVIYFNQLNSGGLFFLDPGTYTITYNTATNPEWQLTTDSASFVLDIDSDPSCDELVFGLYPINQESELVTSLGGLFPRCNTTNLLQAQVKNTGSTIASGTLWLEVDESLDTIFFVNNLDTFVPPNRYGWHFADLAPGFNFSGEMLVEIPGPPDFPVGDSLRFNTYADFTDALGSGQSPEQNIQVEMRCSYDPNDKLVQPAREGDWTLFEETLTYTIRFQNTGNDVAFDVQIRDTLDPNLDPTSLRVLGTSHPFQLNTSLTDSRYLVFDFPRIFLPDSTSNPVGSQGFVTFQIDAIDGLPESTPILNRAGIYFDANPPIITNYTRNLMVSELPTVGFRPSPAVEVLQVIPNPTQEEVYLLGTNVSQGRVEVCDPMGRVLQTSIYNKGEAVDLSALADGVYWILLRGEGQVLTGKVVKF